MLTAEDRELAVECIAIYIGDYPAEKQYAASIILKMLFKERYQELQALLREETGFKVNHRGDSKVVSWAKKVKKNGKCEICGAKDKLVAHHRIPWEYSIKGRTDLNNGQCLCENCHKMIHNDDKCLEYMEKKYEQVQR